MDDIEAEAYHITHINSLSSPRNTFNDDGGGKLRGSGAWQVQLTTNLMLRYLIWISLEKDNNFTSFLSLCSYFFDILDCF